MANKHTQQLPSDDKIAHAIAGAGGGLLSMALTYPLITLSTRAQVESSRAKSDFLDAVQKILHREGGADLYAGLNSALLGISITNFVYYYWYEFTRTAFLRAATSKQRALRNLTTMESIIAGAIAGSATVLLTNPIWVVNTRMTTRRVNDKAGDCHSSTSMIDSNSAKASSTLGTLLTLIHNEGPQVLFAGVLPALVLVVNPILQYSIFEQLKNLLAKDRKMTPTLAFLLGAIGKLFATTITYPYITLKSRMHVAGRDETSEGMMNTMKRIIREEGYLGLYKGRYFLHMILISRRYLIITGIGPKVSQSVLTAAFLFAFKDIIYNRIVQLRYKAKNLV